MNRVAPLKTIALITNHAGYTPQSVMGMYTLILAQHLVKNGYQINYYCWDVFCNTSQLPSGLNIIHYSKSHFWSSIIQDIISNNIELVFYNYLPTVASKYGIPIKEPYYIYKLRLQGIKVITNFHETVLRWNFRRPWLTAQAFFQRLAAYVLLKCSVAVISSLDRYVNYLSNYNPNTFNIPIGSAVVPLVTDNNLLKDPNQQFTIACFGNRNYTLLLQAISILNAQNIPIHVLIIGFISPKHISDMDLIIEKLNLKDQVQYTGVISNEVLSHKLQQCHIAFSYEPVDANGRGGASFKSTSLLAAFAFGLPIISTKGDMNNSDFYTHVPIRLINDHDKDALIVHIKVLYLNTSIRLKMIQDTRYYYKQHLSWDAITNKHIALIRNFQ